MEATPYRESPARHSMCSAGLSAFVGPLASHRARPYTRGMSFESVGPTEVPENAHLIDVREDQEWAAGHAPNAQHIAASGLLENLDQLPEDGDLYIICRSGGRSAQVTQWLNQNGFDAINVTGGMDQWFMADLPLVSDDDSREPYVL